MWHSDIVTAHLHLHLQGSSLYPIRCLGVHNTAAHLTDTWASVVRTAVYRQCTVYSVQAGECSEWQYPVQLVRGQGHDTTTHTLSNKRSLSLALALPLVLYIYIATAPCIYGYSYIYLLQ